MKNLSEITHTIRRLKPALEQNYGVNRIGIFGSYATGVQDSKSDLDIIIDLNRPVGLIKFMEIEHFLSQKLGVPVDLLTFNSLKGHMKSEILPKIRYV